MPLPKTCRPLITSVSSAVKKWSLAPRNYRVITFSTPGKSSAQRADHRPVFFIPTPGDSSGFVHSCLRSWFQRQQTCPTCRMDVLRATNNNQAPAPAQAAAPAPAAPANAVPAAPNNGEGLQTLLNKCHKPDRAVGLLLFSYLCFSGVFII